ncbi:unnamed protein product, partial [Meganyctiphanes norvegica]
MSVERRGTKALELWARRATEGYSHVSINNMTTSWRDGMAFCALVHRYRPDLIEFSSLKPENVLENNALAFRLAEQHLGIPALLDAEDMVENQVPDRLSVLTYVSQYYQVMHQTFTSSGLTAPKRKDPSPDISHGQSPTKIKAGLDTTPKTSITRKSEKVLTGGRGMVCVACTNPVFLAERLMVGSPGQLMHRTCFRCARCSTQLNIASYYETEKGQYCCETCPDEERFISAQQPSSDKSMTTSSKTSLTYTDNVDTDDSDSDESSDSESTSDCAKSMQDVQDAATDHSSQNNKSLTPEPLKPRSVFLSKEMLGHSSEVSDKISIDGSCENLNSNSNNISKVSSSDLEAKSDVSIPDIRTNDSYTSRQNDCDNAKGYVIDPPESNSLSSNAGQGQNKFSKVKASSIVSERLKLFMDKEAKSKSESSRYSINDKNFSEICKDDNVMESTEERHVVNSSLLKTIEKENTIQLEGSSENRAEISDKKSNISIDENRETFTENIIDVDVKNIDGDTSKYKSVNINLETEENNESYEDKNIILEKENDNKPDIDEELLDKNKEINRDSEVEYNPFGKDEIDVNQEIKTKINDNLENNNVIIKKIDSPEEYPDDLNPFGDEDDNDENIVPALPTSPPPPLTSNETPFPTIIETTPDTPPAKPKRTLISANINPFEEDEDEEDIEQSKKVIPAPTKASLNPFWSDDEEPPEESEGGSEGSPKPKGAKPPRPPPPTLSRYSPNTLSSFGSAGNTPTKGSPGGNTTPRKRISAPPPPSVNSKELFPQDSSSVTPTKDNVGARPPSPSPSTVSRLKKKGRRAPAPPPGPSPLSSRASITEGISGDTTSINSLGATSMTGSVTSQGKYEEQDEVMSWKHQKDMKNNSNKLIGSSGNENASNVQKTPSKSPHSGLTRRPSCSKSEAGEWQRKKGPAPPRPVPQKRAIKKLPMKTVQTELYDI